MAPRRDRKDVGTEQARQGAETGTVRWVLHISLGLAIVAGIILYFTFFPG